ncbi:hypothetical protein EWH08_11925 [Sphingobium indicum]|uniref:Uncharacterized protein n=1 Tax=Sphingobium indicum TaxID=332055 RepID=A0A4Q4J6V6_9SPHN|nr:hypothetical protein EWH08_11925 [Sphingobium indicum]
MRHQAAFARGEGQIPDLPDQATGAGSGQAHFLEAQRAPAEAGAQFGRSDTPQRAGLRPCLRRNTARLIAAIGQLRTSVSRHPGLDPGSRFSCKTAPRPRQRDPGSSPG